MASTTGLYLPLSIIAGETLDLPFDISVGGTPVVPADVNFLGQFKLTVNSVTTSFTFTFVVDAVDANIMHATYAFADSENLVAGTYDYEIRMLRNGMVKTIFYGTLAVQAAMVT
ncbi:MAG: hypothetical protein MJH10_08625 [Epibacterium sp.]|nr:hypothetical protein [Epibacterium sp.]NQX73601.1 hypothetical protein [Epibacterium sp.]